MKKMDAIDSKTLFNSLGLITAGIGIGAVLGWVLRSKLHKSITKQLKIRSSSSSSLTAQEVFNDETLGPECKLVIVLRNDLKMGKGKAAAQCSHASVLAYVQVTKQPQLLNLWRLSGQRKVVVKVDSEEQLLEVESNAKSVGLITSLIRDAGHTQVIPGTKTVLGVGPGPSQLIDNITGHLKLY